jgi:Fe-S cluster biogenesis protein NfuA
MELEEKVKQVLDEVRPYLQADGGDIEFVGMEGKMAKVRLKGACSGCPSATITLQMGVEAHLKDRIPELEGIVPVM